MTSPEDDARHAYQAAESIVRDLFRSGRLKGVGTIRYCKALLYPKILLMKPRRWRLPAKSDEGA